MRLSGLLLLLPLATCTATRTAPLQEVLSCERGDRAACQEHGHSEQVRLDVGAILLGARLAAQDEEMSGR